MVRPMHVLRSVDLANINVLLMYLARAVKLPDSLAGLQT